MRMRNTLLGFATALAAFGLCACEDTYESMPPKYSDLTFTHTNPTKEDGFHVGDTVLVTAIEKSRAVRIDKADVTWSAQNADRLRNAVGKFVYGTVNPNLTDTLVLTSSGTCSVTMNGRFRSMSADMTPLNESNRDANGFTAEYATISFELYEVRLNKTFRVLPRRQQ